MNIITEDEVIDAVIRFLSKEGWSIVKRCRADQRGEDIVAERDGDRLIVEAKGAGSSKSHTIRYGSEFSKGQVFDHVAKATLKALRVVAAHNARAAIALPDNESHRREVDKIRAALLQVDIVIFWVSSNATVTFDGVQWSSQGKFRRPLEHDHAKS